MNLIALILELIGFILASVSVTALKIGTIKKWADGVKSSIVETHKTFEREPYNLVSLEKQEVLRMLRQIADCLVVKPVILLRDLPMLFAVILKTELTKRRIEKTHIALLKEKQPTSRQDLPISIDSLKAEMIKFGTEYDLRILKELPHDSSLQDMSAAMVKIAHERRADTLQNIREKIVTHFKFFKLGWQIIPLFLKYISVFGIFVVLKVITSKLAEHEALTNWLIVVGMIILFFGLVLELVSNL